VGDLFREISIGAYVALLDPAQAQIGEIVKQIPYDQLRAAAQLRAATGVKTPDALQLVAAIGAGCATLVTNDRRLPPIPGLRIIECSSYVA
jgi:predicted nucleic acid-binding protein